MYIALPLLQCQLLSFSILIQVSREHAIIDVKNSFDETMIRELGVRLCPILNMNLSAKNKAWSYSPALNQLLELWLILSKWYNAAFNGLVLEPNRTKRNLKNTIPKCWFSTNWIYDYQFNGEQQVITC